MKIGKVPENVLKRSVFKQIKSKREEVLVHPGVGEDCAVLGLAPDEVFVLSTDPITGAVSDIGTLAVHVTANDLASAGAEPVGILLTILLPQSAAEADLKFLMKEIESACESLKIEIIGGGQSADRHGDRRGQSKKRCGSFYKGSQTGTGYRRYKMGWAGRNIHYRFGTGGGAVYAVQPGIC